MKIDLLIKGGRVVDPGEDDGLLDVAVKDGRIAAVAPDISSKSAGCTIAADGQLVLPGLVDFHSHVFDGFGYWGVNPSPIAASTGVTTCYDAGSGAHLRCRAFAVTRSKVSTSA